MIGTQALNNRENWWPRISAIAESVGVAPYSGPDWPNTFLAIGSDGKLYDVSAVLEAWYGIHPKQPQ